MTVLGSMTSAADRGGGRWKVAGAADQVVARVRYWIDICARTNAQYSSTQTMRLYRRARGGKAKRGCRAVPARSKAWLATPGSSGPGVKAASYALDDDYVEVVDHPVLDLLANPNPWMNGSDYAFYRFYSQECAGNAYTYMHDRDELYPLAPQYMAIQSTAETPVAGYVWGRDASNKVVLSTDDVMHHRIYPTLETPWVGSSPASSVLRMADLFDAAITSELARWINGGAPMWIAKLPDGTAPDVRQKVRDYLRNEFRGPGKSGNFLVTDSVEIKSLGDSNRNMQYLEGMQMIASAVWAAYGVPQSVMALNSANLASSQTGTAQYLRQTINPRLGSDAQTMTEWMLPRFGLRPGEWWFAYDDPVPDDPAAHAARVVSMMTAGVLTPNEARREMGFEPIEGGDSLRSVGYGGFGRAPEIGSVEKQEPDVPGPGGKGAAVPRRKDASTALAAEIAGWFRRFAEGVTVGQGGTLTVPGGAAAELDGILERGLASVFASSMRAEASSLGASFEAVPERAVRYLANERALIVERVMGTTMDNLRAVIREGMSAGATIPEIAARVRQNIEETYDWRAENIARTETANAAGAGRDSAFVELGWKKRWELGGGPCPMCEGFAASFGGPVRGGDPFAPAGSVWIGTDGKTYTADRDIRHEPLHPSCRCTTVGVAPEAVGP